MVEITRNWQGGNDPIGTQYHFPIGDGKVELVAALEYDYGYCYQGIILKFAGDLYYGQFVGPYGDEIEKEDICIWLDKPMKCVDKELGLYEQQ